MNQKMTEKTVEISDQTSDHRNYWRANLIVISALMGIWFFVGYVISIFSIGWFNTFKIGKLGVGFWFAQQGSIITFVLLVLIYAVVMDRLDARFSRGTEREEKN